MGSNAIWFMAFSSLVGMLAMMLAIFGVVIFVYRNIWENTKLATLYRKQQGDMANEGPSWTMVYKLNNKQQEVRVLATTEVEALQIIAKYKVRYDKIISLTKTT